MAMNVALPTVDTTSSSDLELVLAFDESEDQQRAALRTRHNRQQQLLRLASSGPLLSASTASLTAWLDTVPAPGSRSDYLVTFGRFFRWAVEQHLVDVDPTLPLRPREWHRHFDSADFPELLHGFWLAQKRRNLSTGTIDSRRQRLGHLQESLGERSLLDATADDIERHLDGLGIEPKTRHVYLSHYKAFYRYAIREGLVESNPCDQIEVPLLRQYVPRPIGDADLVLALQEAPVQVRAMLCLGAFQGMRAKEVAGLQRADILDKMRPPMIVVSAPKGRRQRTIPLHPETWQALEALGLPRTGPIFRFDDGAQMTPWKVSHTVGEYLRSVGVDATLHQCRHWMASKLYANTLDLRMVQTMLGHASPASTAIYTAFNPGDAVSAVTALAPDPG